MNKSQLQRRQPSSDAMQSWPSSRTTRARRREKTMHGNGNGNIKQGRNSEMSMSTRCLRHPRKLLHAFIVGIASLILIATFKLALDFSRGNFSSVDKNVRSEKHTIVTSTENGRKSDLMQPRQINAQHHRWRNEKEFNMEVLRKAVERNAGPRKVDGDSLEGEGQNKKDFGEQNSLQQINDINSIIENSLPASHVTQSDTKYNGGETKSVGHRNESKLESAPVDIPQFARLTNNAPPCTPISPSEISFTLVTQASDERLWMLIEHCRRWAGPISLAVYTNNSTEDIRSYLETGCKTCNTTNLDSSVSQKKSSLGCIKRRDQLHIQTLPTLGTPDGDYPINHLRNMALRGVNTTHVVYVDVDFWPSDNLYSTLFHPDSRIRFEFSVDAHLAIVVPSFEYTPECHKSRQCQRHASHISQMPRTKREVLLLAKQKLVTVFDPTNPGGYSSTRYSEWAEMSQGELMDIPCFRSNRYEPFFVVRLCNDLPPYQEAFTGYGKNKISTIMQMRYIGYRFAQLGGVFFVHYPHQYSKTRAVWNVGWNLRKRIAAKKDALASNDWNNHDWTKVKKGQIDGIFVQFKEWMKDTLEDTSRVPMCDDAQDDEQMLWVA